MNIGDYDVAPNFIAIIHAVRGREESPADIAILKMEWFPVLQEKPRGDQDKDIETCAHTKPCVYAPDQFLPVPVQISGESFPCIDYITG